jgi:hypothetical protein
MIVKHVRSCLIKRLEGLCKTKNNPEKKAWVKNNLKKIPDFSGTQKFKSFYVKKEAHLQMVVHL